MLSVPSTVIVSIKFNLIQNKVNVKNTPIISAKKI